MAKKTHTAEKDSAGSLSSLSSPTSSGTDEEELSVSAPEDTTPRCTFLDLPPELVELVFSFAYSKRPPRGPICKALLPSHRAHVFAKVKVTSTWGFSGLIKKLEEEPTIAPRIKSFRISMPQGLDWPKTGEDLITLFKKPVNVAHLGIEKPQEILKVVLERNLLNLLPKLESAYLDCVFLPLLFILTIADPREGSLLSALLNSATQLERLSLIDMPHSFNLNALLADLPEPILLKDLALDAASACPLDSIAAKMADFISLQHLTLADSITYLSRPFLAALRSLPVQHLTFGFNLVVELRTTLPLLSGPDKLPQLKHLSLDMFAATRGLDYEDCIAQPWDFDDTWKIPRYPAKLPRNDLEQLIKAATKSGLVVDGTAVEALEIEDDFEAQRKELKKYLRKYAKKRNEGWLSESESECEL
ncbi:hypothetical protein JCM6882_007743 [Rhodosporidiobolus microsporus]